MEAQDQRALVSVVIAAYNSSARLMCAVQSALQQSYGNVEVVVVGDAVTDDSETRLLSLGDPRIRWENLPTNWGEQSVPSNRGIRLSQGEYVLFLNQDDLWMPDHVSSCLTEIEAANADVVCSPYLVVHPASRPGDRPAVAVNRLDGVSARHPSFDPLTFVPASCTAWRRSAIQAVGGWRTAGEVTVSPSQDLLFRGSKAGLRILVKDDASVLVFWSGQRPGAFADGTGTDDNEAWLEAIRNEPTIVQAEIVGAGVRAAAQARRDGRAVHVATAIPGRVVGAVQQWLGIHPATFGVMRRYRRQGGFVNAARVGAGLGRREFPTGAPMDKT